MQLSDDEVHYRLRLAEGFLEEASQDSRLGRWRSCAANSQMAVENAGKAALATLGPVGRTHNPAMLLQRALDESRFPDAVRPQVERLIACARLLGPAVHMETDYGDERAWRTPCELFDQPRAEQALALAEQAVALAKEVVQARPP
jgi:HEPN domain-containing protein